MGSIGRPIILPGIPNDPSICVIAASHRPPIATGCMDLRRGPKLGPLRRPRCPRLGTTVQKVSGLGYYLAFTLMSDRFVTAN